MIQVWTDFGRFAAVSMNSVLKMNQTRSLDARTTILPFHKLENSHGVGSISGLTISPNKQHIWLLVHRDAILGQDHEEILGIKSVVVWQIHAEKSVVMANVQSGSRGLQVLPTTTTTEAETTTAKTQRQSRIQRAKAKGKEKRSNPKWNASIRRKSRLMD